MKRYLFVSVFLLIVSLVFGQTEVSGGIFSDETWTPNGSPYIITGTTVVFLGTTLSIEPGVVIKFQDGVDMRVQGAINAIGSETDSIIFTSDSDSPHLSSWEHLDFEYQSSLNFDFVILEYSNIAIKHDWVNPNSYIKNSTFRLNNIVVESDVNMSFPIIDTDFAENNIGINLVAYADLLRCRFINNGLGAHLYNSEIHYCQFIGNEEVGLRGSTSIISNTEFLGNNVGLEQSFSGGSTSSVISNVKIKYNNIGLRITGNNPMATFTESVLCDNIDYNVVNTSEYSGQNLTNNCWCTDDIDEISESIYDAHEDISLGLVIFEPLNDNCEDLVSIEEPLEINSNTDEGVVYPNPATHVLLLKRYEGLEYSIYSIGSVLLDRGIANQKIDISFLARGTYIILLKDKFGFELHDVFIKE